MNTRYRIAFLRIALACAAASAAATPSTAAPIAKPAWPLRVKIIEVAPGVRKGYLEDRKGKPFLWNADTSWYLPFKAADDEVIQYFDDRARRGITVVQISILPWTRKGADNWNGQTPFTDWKFDQPNEAYWKHFDYVVKAAKQRGITLAGALAWSGCCGEALEKILQSEHNTASEYAALRSYATFLAKRYAGDGNLIVFLGGDSNANHEAFRQVAVALKATAPEMLITHHSSAWFCQAAPCMQSSTAPGQHGQGDYLDVSWTYTYWPGLGNRPYVHPYWINHVEWNRNQRVPAEVSKVRPYLLGESGYENERGSAVHRVRRQMHWSILAGGTGHGFGNRPIWPFAEGWKEALSSPGSRSLGAVHTIYTKRSWWLLVPEQPKPEFFSGEPLTVAGARTFVVSGQEPYEDVVTMEEGRGRKFVTAARTTDGKLIMAYFPHDYSKPGLEIDMTALSGPGTAVWADPVSAEEKPAAEGPLANSGTRTFTPPGPNSAGDRDWVLILQAAKGRK